MAVEAWNDIPSTQCSSQKYFQEWGERGGGGGEGVRNYLFACYAFAST